MVVEALQRREIGCPQIKQHLLLLSDECEVQLSSFRHPGMRSAFSHTHSSRSNLGEERGWWLLGWGRGDAEGGGFFFLNITLHLYLSLPNWFGSSY